MCIHVLREDSSRCQPEWPKGMLGKSRQMWVLKVKCENIKDTFWDFYHGIKDCTGEDLPKVSLLLLATQKLL